jgi:hypothetical protein
MHVRPALCHKAIATLNAQEGMRLNIDVPCERFRVEAYGVKQMEVVGQPRYHKRRCINPSHLRYYFLARLCLIALGVLALEWWHASDAHEKQV